MSRTTHLSAMVLATALGAGVMAPLLANNRPLCYFGINYSEYQDAYRVLVARPESRMPRERMARHLSPTDAVRLSAMVEQASIDPASQFRIRTEFDPRTIVLVPRLRWPVAASITIDQVAVLGGYFAGAIAILARCTGRLRRLTTWVAISVAGLAPLLILWLEPRVKLDRADYKNARRADGSTVISWAIWPPISFGAEETDLTATFAPPGQAGHLLGTDGLGRDVAARLIWGARTTLAIAFLSVAVTVLVGLPVGAATGYFRGLVDATLSRLIEAGMCLPGLFLALALAAVVGPGELAVVATIGLTSWPGIARLARGEFLRLREAEFVTAARSVGCSSGRIMLRHVLPNALGPVLVGAAFGTASAILTESTMSFLGVGAPTTTPTWGGMLSIGREAAARAWWLSVPPGLAIVTVVLAVHVLAEAARRRLDPWRRVNMPLR